MGDFMKRAIKIFDKALDGMTFLVGCLLVFIMLSVCADVILRNFLKMPLIWVTEVIEVMLLYITFLGTAWLLREEGHVQVDIIISRLGPKTVSFLGVISSLIGLFISIVLTIFGTSVTLDYYYRGVYTPTAMEIPIYIILLIIPVGSFFLFVQFFRRTLLNVAGFLIESARPTKEDKA